MHLQSLFAVILLTTIATPSFLAFVCSKDLEFKKSRVRVVTDSKLMESKYGVPIEYWYSEPGFTSDTGLSSVPGCPQSINEMPWVYYGTPPRCFLAGTRGPCESAAAIFPQRGSPYGVCGCLCLLDPGYPDEDIVESERYIHCKNVPASYPYLSHHGQIYDKNTKMCHNLFDQGPCNGTSVIIEVKDGSFGCVPDCVKHGICTDDCEAAEESGICVKEPVSVAARPNTFYLSKHECPENQRFSSTLKKCIKKFIGNLGLG